jgi:hypothetical protein
MGVSSARRGWQSGISEASHSLEGRHLAWQTPKFQNEILFGPHDHQEGSRVRIRSYRKSVGFRRQLTAQFCLGMRTRTNGLKALSLLPSGAQPIITLQDPVSCNKCAPEFLSFWSFSPTFRGNPLCIDPSLAVNRPKSLGLCRDVYPVQRLANKIGARGEIQGNHRLSLLDQWSGSLHRAIAEASSRFLNNIILALRGEPIHTDPT